MILRKSFNVLLRGRIIETVETIGSGLTVRKRIVNVAIATNRTSSLTRRVEGILSWKSGLNWPWIAGLDASCLGTKVPRAAAL